MGFLKKIIHWLKKIKCLLMGNYPLSKYHFRVDWGGAQIGFTEVTGLSMEFAVIEHRNGAAVDHGVVKLPGLRKFSNIVLKRAIADNDKDFINWVKTVQLNSVERRNIVIILLNERHEPVVSWRVRNAWPCKYVVGDLVANSNEVLIETLELAHEGFEMEA
jgi:phage tail-like protein